MGIQDGLGVEGRGGGREQKSRQENMAQHDMILVDRGWAHLLQVNCEINNRNRREQVMDDFQTLSGVGPSLAVDLRELGFSRVADLVGQDPERMFDDLCGLRGERIDRCVLYVFRCAVYQAETDRPDPDLKLWWNWKDVS